MREATLTRLSVLVFALVLVSFLVRAFGQFVVGPRTATLLAGPIALLAGIVLLVVVSVYTLARVGVVALEPDDVRQ